MANPAARGHALAIARKDHRTGSQAVFVLELAFENVSDDFHVAMRVCREAVVGCNPIFVNDAQRTKSHPLRIPIVAEAESVLSFEPAVVFATTLLAATNLNHGISPLVIN